MSEHGDAPTLQQQARALGDPTRHDLFRYLLDADRPVGVAELTGHVQLNHNAVRQHLAKLVAAGLIDEGVARPTGRGRPPLTYTVAPGAESRWGATGPYERLSLLLGEIIRTSDAPVEVGRRAGRREHLGSSPVAEPIEVLMGRMARHGFEPALTRDGDSFEIVLQTCPFERAALADPDTICELHLGLAYGAADHVGGLVVDELVPRDPRRAQCRLRGHLTAP